MCHLDWLNTYRDEVEQDRARFRARERRWSHLRLLLFLVVIALVVVLRHNGPLAVAAGVAALGVFAAAVGRHGHWQARRTQAEGTLTVIQESLQASTRRDRPPRGWERPCDPADPLVVLPAVTDDGPTWPLTEQERDDLDLYGPPVGLFGLLNRTSTPPGARRLRDRLDRPCLSREHVEQRQRAVRWLATHEESRLGLMGSLVPLRRQPDRLDAMVRLLHVTPAPPRSVALTTVRLWSMVSVVLLPVAIAGAGTGQYLWLRVGALLLIANFLLLFSFRRLTPAVTPWASLSSTLGQLLAIARRADAELPESEALGLLKKRFGRLVAEARIPSLCAWLEWAGLHGLVRELLNAVALLDLHVAAGVLSRIASHRDLFLQGLSAVAELEALCSLASLSAELPVACYPQTGDQAGLSIEEGRHPLLLEPDVTPNSLHLAFENRTWVITGPNAAGKSTFLRMVGVNLLLAQTGSAVAARAMTWAPVRLITDVRIRDDLAQNESYFLSEVRRLRRLVLDSNAQIPVLGLIDEPFRGTNSQERIAAGIALLEHLMASPHFLLIATHEDLLAQVAGATASARNYHFQEQLQEGGIHFDYQLRPGPATTKTALHILAREGYPNSLLERARQIMAGGTQGPALA